jgi:hypothetical protein
MKYVTSIERNARKESLLEGIEVCLKLKFGNEGLSLLPEISQLENIEQLRTILTGLKTVTSVLELQQIYQPITE